MNKKTLVLGASLKTNRYSNYAINRLVDSKHKVFAIGLKSGEVAGVTIETELISFEDIDTVTLYLNPKRQEIFYNYIVSLNPKRVILKDTLYGKTTLSGQSNGRGFSLSSELNKNYANGWFLNAQGTLRKNGDFEAPDYVLTNTGLVSQGFSVRTGKKNFEIHGNHQ